MSNTQKAIGLILAELKRLLKQKNDDYGDSWLEPGILATAGVREKLWIRIDDKLRRMQNLLRGAEDTVGESLRDTILDLIGYLVLVLVDLDTGGARAGTAEECSVVEQQTALVVMTGDEARAAILDGTAPDNLHVRGGLDLGCTGVTALPEGLNVGGGLDLYGCTGITALPEGLNVGGGLDLYGCTGITALPEGLHVRGGLDLRGTGITALPENLRVRGGLDLRGTGITALSEGLHVRGGLDLRGTGITALPENLRVDGYLDLYGCTGITALPDNLRVGGWLDLRGTGIREIPTSAHIGGGVIAEEGQLREADAPVVMTVNEATLNQ